MRLEPGGGSPLVGTSLLHWCCSRPHVTPALPSSPSGKPRVHMGRCVCVCVCVTEREKFPWGGGHWAITGCWVPPTHFSHSPETLANSDFVPSALAEGVRISQRRDRPDHKDLCSLMQSQPSGLGCNSAWLPHCHWVFLGLWVKLSAPQDVNLPITPDKGLHIEAGAELEVVCQRTLKAGKKRVNPPRWQPCLWTHWRWTTYIAAKGGCGQNAHCLMRG